MRITFLVVAGLLLTACGAEPETMDPNATFLGAQTKALEAAKALEETVLESTEQLDESLKKSGG